jgi:hypothetical protein
VQYGTGAYRVMRWQLSPDGRKVIGSETLEYRTDLVSDPTTGVILGDSLYFISNTGIYNLQDDKMVDLAKLEQVHIAVVPLKRNSLSKPSRVFCVEFGRQLGRDSGEGSTRGKVCRSGKWGIERIPVKAKRAIRSEHAKAPKPGTMRRSGMTVER